MWKYGVWLVAVALNSFWTGTWVQEYRHGSVTLYHNVDEGTELNHGQPSLEIKFPRGVAFNQIRAPGGDWYPDPMRARWVEILPDGREKNWLDRLTLDASGPR